MDNDRMMVYMQELYVYNCICWSSCQGVNELNYLATVAIYIFTMNRLKTARM